MSGNTIGRLFTVTSFGESHGPAIGCIVDGCPPGLELSAADIQPDLDHRRPGKTRHTTQRRESDEVQILSGVFEGRTTGTPIGLLIHNTDQRSKDYSEIMERFRPGHADYTYQQKYGLRDYRGGGRSSARETATRVAAGGIAKKYLREQCGIEIRGYLAQLGPIRAERLVNHASVTGDEPRDHWRITVTDNGIGVAAPYREKIFGLFERLDQEVEGTGIGLALVKRIVEVHGGRIWLESREGQGSTFSFSLPFA